MTNLITFGVSLLLAGTSFATTWTVDDDGKADFNNIQAAVDAASDGDEIIVMPGIYTSTADEVVNMLGKEVWLHSGNGAELTIIDGQGTRRGIKCSNYETSNTIIEGFTITNGNVDSDGGGIYCNGGSPTIKSCIISNNFANSQGGGIACSYSSSPTITNCTISSNEPWIWRRRLSQG